MTYSVRIKRSAVKEIAALPAADRERVITAIDGLAQTPFQGTQLKGSQVGLRRVRVGTYRIIYEVQKTALVVLVLRVGHRREIYR